MFRRCDGAVGVWINSLNLGQNTLAFGAAEDATAGNVTLGRRPAGGWIRVIIRHALEISLDDKLGRPSPAVGVEAGIGGIGIHVDLANDQAAVIVVAVLDQGRGDLFHVGGAHRGVGLPPGTIERWKENSHQQRDDADDHKQFDQCESATVPFGSAVFHTIHCLRQKR